MRGCRAAWNLQERLKVVLDVLWTAAPELARVVENGRTRVVRARSSRVLRDDVLLLAAVVDAASFAIGARWGWAVSDRQKAIVTTTVLIVCINTATTYPLWLSTAEETAVTAFGFFLL